MKLLVIILVVLGSISSFAQSARQYLDDEGKLLSGPEGALYYRETTPKEKLYVVKNFYASNEQLAMEATCSAVAPTLVYAGLYKTYFKNGLLMEEGLYEGNKKRGPWKTYYENGQQHEETFYEKEKTLHRQHWDESGMEHLVNGSGHYVEKNTSEGDQNIEITDYQMIASYSIDPVSSDSIYDIVQEEAAYPGGLPVLYDIMRKKMHYPKDARRGGIEGKVYIEFIIEKDGKVGGVKVLKGPGGGLKEEAARVVKLIGNWTPAKVKGKPVAQKMVLPIEFKLG
jgi:TonB family protein